MAKLSKKTSAKAKSAKPAKAAKSAKPAVKAKKAAKGSAKITAKGKPAKGGKPGKAAKPAAKIIAKNVQKLDKKAIAKAKLEAKLKAKAEAKAAKEAAKAAKVAAKLAEKAAKAQAKAEAKAAAQAAKAEAKALGKNIPRIIEYSPQKIEQTRLAILEGKIKSGRIASLKASMGADAIGVCREVACELIATTRSYCRLHYIKNWKRIQRKDIIMREGKLIQYIEELVSKYPDKYIEAIRADLVNEQDFAKVINDLEIDESIDEFTETSETENDEAVIENIRRDFVETEDFGTDDGDF